MHKFVRRSRGVFNPKNLFKYSHPLNNIFDVNTMGVNAAIFLKILGKIQLVE